MVRRSVPAFYSSHQKQQDRTQQTAPLLGVSESYSSFLICLYIYQPGHNSYKASKRYVKTAERFAVCEKAMMLL